MAAHSLMVIALAAIWTVMFMDRASIVSRLDTIALVIAVLAMTPLVVTRRAVSVIIYGAANLAMLYIFMLYHRVGLDLPVSSFWDYLADNTMVIIFVTIVSYNILSINRSALSEADRLNRELQKKNEELGAANQELQAAIEELEETNETLIQTNSEMEQANRLLSESEERSRLLSALNARLNEIFISLAEAENLEILYEKITGSFKLLTGAMAAATTIYEPATKTLRLVAVATDEEIRQKLAGGPGSSPFDIPLVLPDQIRAHMTAQVINRVENLEALTFGAIGADASRIIMKAVNCNEIIVLALYNRTELLGTTVVFLSEQSVPAIDDAMKTFAYMASLSVIRKRGEEALASSLKEKEILLKEVHHRVKNNLQIIISLLNMQAMKLNDENLLQYFNVSNNRIRSIAKVHEKLYAAGDMASIDFSDYIREIINDLYQSADLGMRRVALDIKTDPLMLGLKEAIPCGLIVNEMICNAFKHAFPANSTADPLITVGVTVGEGSRIRIEVADNGIGMKEEESVGESKKMGLFLVKLLTQQLNGTLQIDRTGGTRFVLEFILQG